MLIFCGKLGVSALSVAIKVYFVAFVVSLQIRQPELT
jgi:hypothetical protein